MADGILMIAKFLHWFSGYLERHPSAKVLAAWAQRRRVRVLLSLWLVAHLIGALTSVKAIMEVRTAQGTIAWVTALNAAPVFSVPAYWIFGRSQFQGYVLTRRKDLETTNPVAQKYLRDLEERGLLAKTGSNLQLMVEKLAKWRFTVGNDADLLVDGKATFDSIFAGLEKATNYILVEYYIFHDDQIGREFKKRLMEKARAGVRVYLLFDEVGSPDFKGAPLEELRKAGVDARKFNTRRGPSNRFQVNFRNHRKIVVVDGQEAWVGGLNVGDEYLGRDPKMSPWRDTHVKVMGPVAQGVQMAFLEDWQWASEQVLDLPWDPRPSTSGASRIAMALPTGPVDSLETCTLVFLSALNMATNRLWIATPYFVPDEQFISAIQLAALRGVDVRIILPGLTDNQLVQRTGWTFVESLEKVGVKVYRYKNGFMHQKVMLVDDRYSAIGTANFDNRSFRLNFEITMAFADNEFAGRVKSMLEKDFANAEPVHAAEFQGGSFWNRFAMRCARLSAPVQ
jgi:cardiolipin synthase A/B